MSVKIDGNGPITGADSTFSTGDFKWRQAQTPGAGWVAGTGGTIGNVGSNASNRANADTLALFTLWWTDYTDAQLPIYTSAGVLSTRGANAAADWAANKKIAVFDVRGRFIRAPGTINGLTFANGNSYADMFQGHQHQMPDGTNNGPAANPGQRGSYNWTNGAGANSFDPSSNNVSPISLGANGAPRYGAETAPVSIVMLPCYKL